MTHETIEHQFTNDQHFIHIYGSAKSFKTSQIFSKMNTKEL